MEIAVQDGSFAYKGSHTLWKDINFSVESGEILAILGPNGVGKTTMLKCLMNLLPWKTGTTLIDGISTKEMNQKDFWKLVAYVPQGKNSTVSFTVRDFVLMGRNLYIGAFGNPSKEDFKIAEEMMELVGVSHLADRFCYQLSGGQFQMVLIARALCTEPKCLILDEPESNLDFRNQLLVLNLMQKLAKEKNLICIFNTHYPEHGMRIADKAILVYKNDSVIAGACKSVLTEDNLANLFQVQVHIAKNSYEDEEYQTVTALKILSS